MLCQKQDVLERVIAYASRGLSSSDSNYSAYKLEFTVLKGRVIEKFHHYLYCSRCRSFIDFPLKEFLAVGSGLGERANSMVAIAPTPDVEVPVLLKQNINKTKKTLK